MTTTYTYSYNPNTQTATLDADAQGHHQWKKTTLDGFGRAIEVDSGYDTTTVTIVETQYAPCACSPIGKMWRTSLPHAPGANVQWTTYVYDARGRTIEVWAPDGSITHYSYAGNVTTVTDPAGKWKKFTYDAQNNLVMVTEPDPANGNNTLLTNYSYNAANQLVQVTMTRGTVTQTRTFQWTGSDLTQSTNPENGTVTYTYDGAHHVTQRVDAVGQRTTYAYDSFGRLMHVRHYDASNNEQAGQDVDYGYDNPDWNAWGRLSTVSFGAGRYEYEYNTAGRVTAHRLVRDDGTTEADYQWDNRGRMTHMSGVDTLNYQYDAMSRLVGMTDANNGTVATATYDGNSQLSELDWGGFREVRQYNQLQQLTRMTTTKPLEGTTLMDMQYIYVAGANNGRVTQTLDGVTGDTQAFGYDALNRLVSVTSSLGNNESMAYDGFGNLTSMNGVSYTVDATTNRRTGGDGTTTYDANGNVTQWGQAGYAWDIENRMTSNGAVYDPWGKRVAVGYAGILLLVIGAAADGAERGEPVLWGEADPVERGGGGDGSIGERAGERERGTDGVHGVRDRADVDGGWEREVRDVLQGWDGVGLRGSEVLRGYGEVSECGSGGRQRPHEPRQLEQVRLRYRRSHQLWRPERKG